MRRAIFVLFFLLSAQPLFAQGTVISTSQIAWVQTGQDLATITAYTYRHYDDAIATGGTQPYTGGIVLTNVTCAAQTPPVAQTFDCQAPFPAFTPGNHQLSLTASNAAGETVKSVPLSFVFVVVPATPTTLHIK